MKMVMCINIRVQLQDKCEQYWPTSGNVQYGEFTVHSLEEMHLSDYVIRKFKLTKVLRASVIEVIKEISSHSCHEKLHGLVVRL